MIWDFGRSNHFTWCRSWVVSYQIWVVCITFLLLERICAAHHICFRELVVEFESILIVFFNLKIENMASIMKIHSSSSGRKSKYMMYDCFMWKFNPVSSMTPKDFLIRRHFRPDNIWISVFFCDTCWTDTRSTPAENN